MILKVIIVIFICSICPFNTTSQIVDESRLLKFSRNDTALLRQHILSIESLIERYPDSAIKLLEVVYQNSLPDNFYFGMAAARLYQGNAYLQKSDYANALSKYKETMVYLYNSPNGIRSIPSVFNNIGNIYHQINDYENAINYYYKAIWAADSIRTPVNVDYIYQNLAGLLVDLNQTSSKIFGYLNIAETSALKRKNYSHLAKNYINRGYAYKNIGNWDSSFNNFIMAYNIALEHNLIQDQYVALLNIGVMYNVIEDYPKAIENFNKAQKLSVTISPFFKNRLYKDLGLSYVNSKNYTLAEKYLKKALKESERTHQSGILLYTHKELANLYEKKQEYDKAFLHASMYAKMKDSLENKEIIHKVNFLESKYSVAKKNEEIFRKELLIQAQNNRIRYKNLLIVFALFCFTGLITFVFFNNKQRKKSHLKSVENIKLQQKTDLLLAHINGEEKERSRIARELHDGLGGLSSALSLNIDLLKNERDPLTYSKLYHRIAQISESLHSEIKRTAHNLTPDILVQYDLIESIRIYCYHVSDATKTDFIVQPIGNFKEISSELRLVIYRIVQELVNNVVKHSQATSALVQLVKQENALVITVEDNGIGYDVSKTTNGLGLKNIATRVKALNGHFAFESSIGEGSTTIIEFYNYT